MAETGFWLSIPDCLLWANLTRTLERTGLSVWAAVYVPHTCHSGALVDVE